MSLKPWREIAEPPSDVREGSFQKTEFAAADADIVGSQGKLDI
jgi:hypothetical protein